MIHIECSGSFSNAENLFRRASRFNVRAILDKYGQLGLEALQNATPKDSGRTAESWGYEIEGTKTSYTIRWTNSNINDGVSIALILQYGHGTGTGGYFAGIDYINPALKPIFTQLANEAWREVTGK